MPQITTRYLGDRLFEAELGNHRLKIDLPASMGGRDRAPKPPELYVASLGGCIGAFVAQYCEECGIDTRDLAVEMVFDSEQKPTRLTNMRAVIHLPHAEVGQRRKAIERVAEHCPVHASILAMCEGGMAIEIRDRQSAAA